ncbi:MAG: T9SS type A sorting domain-containing protein [Candidatus Latescibacteria bacterium]|nr:T9SS type A sorting domain-containing protein [Candidatus Latescibacterota bacterium]
MKKIFVSVLFIIFYVVASAAFAEHIPVLTLEEGANSIALSIVNKQGGDLSGVTVTVDSGQLPSWLTYTETPQTIDVPSSAQEQEKLYLNFEVTGAPDNAQADVPLTVTDALGNTWNCTVTVQAESKAPVSWALHNNYPNPFNPTTTINYFLMENQHTKLTVFNAVGQTVRTLVNQPQTAGNHTVQWDGRNDFGHAVSSGVYFYRLEAGNFVKTKRMMLVE